MINASIFVVVGVGGDFSVFAGVKKVFVLVTSLSYQLSAISCLPAGHPKVSAQTASAVIASN